MLLRFVALLVVVPLAACGATAPPNSSVPPPGSTASALPSVSPPDASVVGAKEALLAELVDASMERRASILDSLREAYGGSGLVDALRVKSNPAEADAYAHEKLRLKQVMDMIAVFADPRGGDALVHYLQGRPAPHWKTEAADRLAEIGDLRAAAILGWRLEQDPLKLYSGDADSEYRMSDTERSIAARLLADLATMYPNAHAQLRTAAESQTLAWMASHPSPHANGMRFLVTAESTAFLPQLRAWADPKDPLPIPGQQPPMPEAFPIAQSALRYLGKTKDPSAFATLTKQLRRRPPNLDVTMASLMQGGLAIVGMAVRSLGWGAADGFAELGDARAVPILEKYIEDTKENEDARTEACFSLAWVSTDADLESIAKRAVADASRPRSDRIASCYLQTLARKTTPAASTLLFNGFFSAAADPTLRRAAARVLGLGAVPDAIAPKLIGMLSDKALHEDAALALLLGGTNAAALTAVESYTSDVDDLKRDYAVALGYFSDDAYTQGHIGRWASNAHACSKAAWPATVLSQALALIMFDNGPHSMTRPVFRHRLLEDARSQAEPQHTQAVLLLTMADERGVLASLRP
jgi:hypothetical protein